MLSLSIHVGEDGGNGGTPHTTHMMPSERTHPSVIKCQRRERRGILRLLFTGELVHGYIVKGVNAEMLLSSSLSTMAA